MTDPSKILTAAKAYRSAMEDPNADGEQTAMLAQRLLNVAEGVEDFGDDERDRRIATEARDLHAKITQVIVPALDQIAVALEAMAERGTASAFKVGDRVRIARKVEVDSAGRDCGWCHYMDGEVGTITVIACIQPDRGAASILDDGGWWFSPEALDRLDRTQARIRMIDEASFSDGEG